MRINRKELKLSYLKQLNDKYNDMKCPRCEYKMEFSETMRGIPVWEFRPPKYEIYCPKCRKTWGISHDTLMAYEQYINNSNK